MCSKGVPDLGALRAGFWSLGVRVLGLGGVGGLGFWVCGVWGVWG